MSTAATTGPASATPEQCSACGGPLDEDQRYCLNCGELRPGAGGALPAALVTTSRRGAAAALESAATAQPRWTLATTLAGLACLLLAMGIGVLIGRGGDETTAQAPITIATPAAAATPVAPAAQMAFVSDWPASKEGWTIALRLLPKATTQPPAVAAAKIEVGKLGAPDAGALDSDAYPILTDGSFVVYSGVFDARKAATTALKALTAKFPHARVVKVGQNTAGAADGGTATTSKGGAAKGSGARTSGADTKKAFEETKKAPKVVGTGQGPPPAKDNKPAAGGGGFEEIG